MSVQKYLRELNGERLLSLLDRSDEVASEQTEGTDERPVHNLSEDLRDSYPGLYHAAHQLWLDFEDNGAGEEFVSGLMAGTLIMAHMIRLAAEEDTLQTMLGVTEPGESPSGTLKAALLSINPDQAIWAAQGFMDKVNSMSGDEAHRDARNAAQRYEGLLTLTTTLELIAEDEYPEEVVRLISGGTAMLSGALIHIAETQDSL